MNSFSQQLLAAIDDQSLEKIPSLLQSALAQDDDDMLFSLAEELYAIGFLSEAQTVYEHLLKKYPDADELRTALADIAIDDGDVEKALTYLDEIQPDSDAYLSALMVKADLYQTEGLIESAERALLQAEALSEQPIIKFALAEFYNSIQSYQKAIPLYRDLLLGGDRKIGQVDLAARLGFAYATVGNYENALAYLEQLKPHERTPDILFQMGMLYVAQKDDTTAIKYFAELVELEANFASVYPEYGQTLERLNRNEEALRIYQLGLAVDQTNSQLYRLAGTLATKLEDDVLADQYLKQAFEIDPENTANVLALARLYLNDQKYNETIELLQPLIEEEQIDPTVYWLIGRAYRYLEDDEQATTFYRLASETFTQQADFLLDYSGYLLSIGEPKTAIPVLHAYTQLVPDDDEAQLRLDDLLN